MLKSIIAVFALHFYWKIENILVCNYFAWTSEFPLLYLFFFNCSGGGYQAVPTVLWKYGPEQSNLQYFRSDSKLQPECSVHGCDQILSSGSTQCFKGNLNIFFCRFISSRLLYCSTCLSTKFLNKSGTTEVVVLNKNSSWSFAVILTPFIYLFTL